MNLRDVLQRLERLENGADSDSPDPLTLPPDELRRYLSWRVADFLGILIHGTRAALVPGYRHPDSYFHRYDSDFLPAWEQWFASWQRTEHELAFRKREHQDRHLRHEHDYWTTGVDDEQEAARLNLVGRMRRVLQSGSPWPAHPEFASAQFQALALLLPRDDGTSEFMPASPADVWPPNPSVDAARETVRQQESQMRKRMIPE